MMVWSIEENHPKYIAPLNGDMTTQIVVVVAQEKTLSQDEGGHMREKIARYKKPLIIKEKKMLFPMWLIEHTTKKKVCHQCSACHGCR